MIPPKIEKWISAGVFPQRVLLSGGNNAIELAVEIAVQLQNVPCEQIESGIHADTIVFRDTGKSFKIDFSDAAKKDEQSEHENARGIVRWAHKKPTAPYRIIILENLERTSREAPHALLKLIEEPPSKTIFLFTTKNHHKLLDTILSRMTVVRLTNKENDFEISEEIQNFLGGRNLLQKFARIEELNKASRDNPDKKIDRTELLEFLEQCILHARFFEKSRHHLELLLETHAAISGNINPKFSLERLAIKLTK